MTNTQHDNAVKKTISSLKRQGFGNFQADLPGYETPEPIGKDERVPDIIATKKGYTKIVEVEPKGSVDQHKDQHSTFKRSASQKSRVGFEIKEF